jgi:uncharacterized membrane protein
MARFEGTHTQRVEVDAPIDAVRAHFADLSKTVAATHDVERSSITGDVIHFVLKAQDLGVVKFQGDFRCRYQWAGGDLSWGTIEGNTDQVGTARFEAISAGRTAVSFQERVAVDLPVPGMMAKMLEPVVAQVLAHEVKGFLERMVASVPS